MHYINVIFTVSCSSINRPTLESWLIPRPIQCTAHMCSCKAVYTQHDFCLQRDTVGNDTLHFYQSISQLSCQSHTRIRI